MLTVRVMLKDFISTPAVFSSCLCIPYPSFREVWWSKVAMVTRYDVISSTRSSDFLLKLPGFNHF